MGTNSHSNSAVEEWSASQVELVAMKKLYDQLFNLLGKRSDAPEFKQVVEDIGKPSRVYESDVNIIYEFAEYGFGMICNQTNNRFWMLGFEFTTQPVKSGAMQPFPEELHAGIISADSPTEVEAKLGVKPKSFKEFKMNKKCTGKYELLPYHFTCIFESAQGSLAGMTVHSLESSTSTN
jgi:hypothetical protein